jgi:hypothetical protein
VKIECRETEWSQVEVELIAENDFERFVLSRFPGQMLSFDATYQGQGSRQVRSLKMGVVKKSRFADIGNIARRSESMSVADSPKATQESISQD